MEKVKVTMVDYGFRSSLYEAVKKVDEVVGGSLKFCFYDTRDVDEGLVNLEAFIQDLRESHIVLLNVMGGDRVSKIICETLVASHNTVIVFVGGSSEIVHLTRLGSFSFRTLSRMGMGKGQVNYETVVKMRERFEKLGKKLPIGMLKHARNYALLLKYYETPTVDNYYAMLLFLMKEYGKIKVRVEIPEPKTLPSMGIMHFKSGSVFLSLEEYFVVYEHRNRPLVGILFYGGHHHEDSYRAAKLLAEKLESYGYGVIPVFSGDLRYYMAIEKFFLDNGKPAVEVLIDLLWFRFAGGPMGGDHTLTFNVLSKLNVPILHGIQLHSKTIEQWRTSKQGISPVETVTTVILPELDGRIEPTVTHGLKEEACDGIRLEEYDAVEDRVEKLAKRAAGWIKLRNKPNSEKRVALILYNYPPGEENIGKAEGLDVFKSLSRLLQALKERGYDLPEAPSGDKLKEILFSDGIVNSGSWIQTPKILEKMIKVPLDTYSSWLKEIPNKPLNDVLKEWGPPPGKIMAYKNALLVPGITLGKIFIGVQPARGIHEDPSKIYHDQDLPPHHQYIAFYKWLKNEFKADAIVHLGTHGTIEFLPGKQVGLSRECYPDILLDDLPNIYLYHAVNSSEASIAKRRSYAVIINHGSPPLTISGLHGDFQELENFVKEYFDAIQYSREKAEEISIKIIEKAEKYSLGNSVEEVHAELEEYKRSLIPKGLHVIGERMPSAEAIDYLTFLSRYDRSEARSLHRLILEARGLSYEEILEKPHKKASNSKLHSELFQETESTVKAIITDYIINGKVNFQLCADVDKTELGKALLFLKEVYQKIQQSDEVGAVLKALNGEFILPGPGGGFVRTPGIYPTGRNTYPLDPTRIPTETAMERGRIVAEEIVKQFYETNGVYPKTVSIVLWGFETMKTGGETLAAIFHLLGVKPVLKGLYIRDLEVIPLEELKRPRIDCVVTMCGIFRDTFYNAVELLDKAFKLVAELDEPEDMNHVKAHMKKDIAKHGEKARFRIFGPPEGLYATSITALIESSEWKSETEIINAYLESMKFAYGENQRNIKAKEVLGTLLSNVDVVSQVRDTVEYEITDLDHYYEFLGGLSRAVEEQRGSNPEVLIADTTREKIKVEDVKDALKRGVITRITNPKWLDAMLEHGMNGATKIADRVEYMLGLAATMHSIEKWMWDKTAENIVLNKERSEKLKKANPWAFRKLVSRLLEAEKRGYWKAEKEIMERLEKEYLETEGTLEESVP